MTYDNAGAVGIFWNVAQQTSLRNIFITLISGAVGLDVCTGNNYTTPPSNGIGGGGTVEDVSVIGGQFGIRVQASQFTFRGLRFSGQSIAAIGLGSLVEIFGFVDTVVENAAQVLSIIDGGRIDTNASTILFIDAILINISGLSIFALPEYGLPLLLENISLYGEYLPSFIVTAGEIVWLESQTYIGRWAGWQGGSGNNGMFVEGANMTFPRGFLPFLRLTPLSSRARPWFNDLLQPPCNARTDCGLIGDNITDDTIALQNCVNTCASVFLPDGIYKLTDTILLKNTTILCGEALSVLYLAAYSTGFNYTGSIGKVLIDTPIDSEAVVLITEISVQAGFGNDGVTLLRWRVGTLSGMW